MTAVRVVGIVGAAGLLIYFLLMLTSPDGSRPPEKLVRIDVPVQTFFLSEIPANKSGSQEIIIESSDSANQEMNEEAAKGDKGQDAVPSSSHALEPSPVNVSNMADIELPYGNMTTDEVLLVTYMNRVPKSGNSREGACNFLYSALGAGYRNIIAIGVNTNPRGKMVGTTFLKQMEHVLVPLTEKSPDQLVVFADLYDVWWTQSAQFAAEQIWKVICKHSRTRDNSSASPQDAPENATASHTASGQNGLCFSSREGQPTRLLFHGDRTAMCSNENTARFKKLYPPELITAFAAGSDLYPFPNTGLFAATARVMLHVLREIFSNTKGGIDQGWACERAVSKKLIVNDLVTIDIKGDLFLNANTDFRNNRSVPVLPRRLGEQVEGCASRYRCIRKKKVPGVPRKTVCRTTLYCAPNANGTISSLVTKKEDFPLAVHFSGPAKGVMKLVGKILKNSSILPRLSLETVRKIERQEFVIVYRGGEREYRTVGKLCPAVSFFPNFFVPPEGLMEPKLSEPSESQDTEIPAKVVEAKITRTEAPTPTPSPVGLRQAAPQCHADQLRALQTPSLETIEFPRRAFLANDSCLNNNLGMSLECGDRARRCLPTHICADVRDDEAIFADWTKRASTVTSRWEGAGWRVNESILTEMATCGSARTSLVLLDVQEKKLMVAGRSIAIGRTPAVLRRVELALRRHPEWFPQHLLGGIPFVLDTGDFACDSSLPLFSIYSAPVVDSNGNVMPAMNFLLPDDTYSEGMVFDNKPFPPMIVPSYAQFIRRLRSLNCTGQEKYNISDTPETNSSYPAMDKTNQTTFLEVFIKRQKKGFFVGSPNHRSRQALEKWLKQVPDLADVHVGHVMGKDVNMAASATEKLCEFQVAFIARGFSASQRDKFVLGAGNAMVRLLDAEVEPGQFLHDLLRPYVHYLPLAYDHRHKKTGSIRCAPQEIKELLRGSSVPQPLLGPINQLALNSLRLGRFLANETLIDRYIAAQISYYTKLLDPSVIVQPSINSPNNKTYNLFLERILEQRESSWKKKGRAIGVLPFTPDHVSFDDPRLRDKQFVWGKSNSPNNDLKSKKKKK